jgi:HEAT repeat protein
MKTLLGVFLAGILLTPSVDIDVAVPPGTPLEWDKDLHQPVPTGWRSRVPTTGKPSDAAKPGAPDPGARAGVNKKGMTVTSHPPIEFGVTNLYQYFGITTVDIVNHIKVEAPGGGLYKDGDVATGGGSGVEWKYMPEHPTELVWTGVAGCLRSILHYELISVPETVAYLCEVGETTLPGTRVVNSPVGEKLKLLVTPVPEQFPAIRGGGTPIESMFNRLVVVELTTGFPHALDPTFARRTLSLGERVYKQVVDAAKSNHSLLARNGVAILANYRTPEAVDELRKHLRSNDPVVRYRALTGLGRLRDRACLPTLIAGLTSADDVWRSACAYTIGVIGDPSAIDELMKVAKATTDIEYLWSLLPAIARLSSPRKDLEEFFTKVEAAILAGGVVKDPPPPPKNMVPPKPEPPGTKLQVVIEMCRLGLAAAGSAAAREQIKTKFQQHGIDGFFVPNQILVCNVLGKMNDGREMLERIVETAKNDRLAVQGLLDLQQLVAETEWLKKQAVFNRATSVRALALSELFERGEDHFCPVAQKVIDGYGGGSDGGQAYVVGTALQLMGKTSRGSVDSVIEAAKKAHAAGMWARREGENTLDIVKANIKICPPLLEIACIELGRLQDPKAIPTLLSILKSNATGGRAEAALALGATSNREAIEALLAALEDPKDGWVRFCAYEVLKKMSGQDHMCDWIFGNASSRSRAVAHYREWAGLGSK